MKQAVGGEGPTKEETAEQQKIREQNEKHVAKAKFANHRYS